MRKRFSTGALEQPLGENRCKKTQPFCF